MEGSQSFILVRKQRRVEQELREWKIYIYIYFSQTRTKGMGKKMLCTQYFYNTFTTNFMCHVSLWKALCKSINPWKIEKVPTFTHFC